MESCIKEEEIGYDDWMKFSSEGIESEDLKDVDLKDEPKTEVISDDENFCDSETEYESESKVQGAKEEIQPKDSEELKQLDKTASEINEPKEKLRSNGSNVLTKRFGRNQSAKVVEACREFSESVAGNKCEFTCPMCGEIFKSWKNVQVHCAKQHQGLRRPMMEYFSKIVCHVCKICSSPVICDHRFLHDHFMVHHKMATRDYCTAYGVKFEMAKKQTKNRFGTLFLSKFYEEKIAKEDEQNCMPTNMELSANIGNLCMFECNVCRKNFECSNGLNWHLQRSFHGKPCYNITYALKFIQKLIGHACKICEEVILCDNYFISRHLRDWHNLSTNQYRRQFGMLLRSKLTLLQDKESQLLQSSQESKVLGNKCSFTCYICGFHSSSWSIMQNHVRKTRCTESYTIRAAKFCDMPGVFYLCKICGKKLLCDIAVFRKHLVNFHKGENITTYKSKHHECRKIVSLDVANMCRYKCDHCQKVFSNTKVLNKHRNNFGLAKEDAQVDKLRTAMVFHTCQICFVELRCETSSIAGHVERSHGMSLTGYAMKTGVRILSDVEATQKRYRSLLQKFTDNLKVFEASNAHEKPSSDKLETICVGNLCEFKCPGCNAESFLNYNVLRCHFKKEHGRKAKNFLPTQIVEALYHRCLLCEKHILCDPYFLSNHLLRHKGITSTKYKSLVELIGGVCFPSINEFRSNQFSATFVESLNILKVRKCYVKLEKLSFI